MTTPRTTSRLIILLLFLAGLLLLRKPVFGQDVIATPVYTSTTVRTAQTATRTGKVARALPLRGISTH
jgi:hypothetical protein